MIRCSKNYSNLWYCFYYCFARKNWIMCGTWQSSFFYTCNFSIGQHATIYLLTISLFSVLILLIPAQVFVRSNYWLSSWGVWSVWIRCNIYVIINWLWDIRVFASVWLKFSVYFRLRTYFFHFTYPLFKIIHINPSILQLILFK